MGFILDGSGSITEAGVNNWDRLLYFIGEVIKQLPEQGTQVGVVVFSRTAELRIKLNDYHELSPLIDDLQTLHYPGSDTNISGALHVAHTQLFNEYNGDRRNASNVAVLITEVVFIKDINKTISHAQDLHKDGIRVICVGIGEKIIEDDIKAISSPPHKKDVDYFVREDFYFSEVFVMTLAESIKQHQIKMTTRSDSDLRENKGEYNWNYVDYFVGP